MTSLSQKNLLNLAQRNEQNGALDQAIQNLEEALRIGPSQEIIIKLCDLYLKDKQEYMAYSLIKEEKDLFSDQEIFSEYSRILQANHFLIEALEVKNLSKAAISIPVSPVDEDEQRQIMSSFKQKKQPLQYDYEQLFKLTLINFKNFAQSLLIDPSLNFAVRIALCEDLTRLGVEDEFSVLVVGKTEKFFPNKTSLLEKEPIYREVVSSIGSRYYHRPSQLPTVLGEVNLILGSLYPKIKEYVDEPDSFASDIASYIEKRDGRGNHELFLAIDHTLPK